MMTSVLPLTSTTGTRGGTDGENQESRTPTNSKSDQSSGQTPTAASETTQGTTETSASELVAPVTALPPPDKAEVTDSPIKAAIEAQANAAAEEMTGMDLTQKAAKAYDDVKEMNKSLSPPEPMLVLDGEVLDPVTGAEVDPFTVIVSDAA